MTQKLVKKRLTREESQIKTREQLLDAAQSSFVTNGYGGTSIRDIASQAGYSQGAFYSNFSSKEDVLLELLRRHMSREATQLFSVIGSEEKTPEQMLGELDLWAASLNRDMDWCMLSIELQLHANRSPSFAIEYQQVWDAHRIALGGVLTALFEKFGRLLPAPANELAAAFMSLAHGLALQKSTTRPDSSGNLIMVFLRGLIASSAKLGTTDTSQNSFHQ